MKQVLVIFLVTVISACGKPIYPLPDESLMKFSIVDLVKNGGSLKKQVDDHLIVASELNRVPFVQVTAEWCQPCLDLRKAMGHELMLNAFESTYIIRVDYDHWEDELPEIGLYIGSVPVFYGLNAEGRATNYSVNGGDWEEDTPDNIAPILRRYFLGADKIMALKSL
ncbi:hypothetical protein A9Q81_17250 [Gammaproteobacteria bacterium 42_54_T18]|nr:hypothetical protein A9Q81_17250 [Gammaproteobacteria bacterium 42_54_T18]